MMVKLLKFGGITYSQIGKFFAIVLFVVGLVTIGSTLGPKLTASTSWMINHQLLLKQI